MDEDIADKQGKNASHHSDVGKDKRSGDTNRDGDSASIGSDTFRPLKLVPSQYKDLDFPSFVDFVEYTLWRHKESRFNYYNNLREGHSRWVFRSKRFLAAAGALGLLLTAMAAGARLAPPDWTAGSALENSDRWLLLLVVAIYALMGAVSFYERATDKASAYFRSVTIILNIRDKWTKFQFELLKELLTLSKAADQAVAQPAARERIVALAEAFCNDLNASTSGELSDWRAEFIASVSELEEVSKKGSTDTLKRMEDLAKQAATSVDQAVSAAKAAEDAARPGNLNLTISGEFEGEAIIFVDGVEARRATAKAVAVGPVKSGVRTLSARYSRGGKSIEASQNVEVRAGVQEVTLKLG